MCRTKKYTEVRGTTSRSTWKRHERETAKRIGGKRNPLSGSNSQHTSGDVIHEKYYVECKYRAHWGIMALFSKVEAQAKRENKIPLLSLKEKGKHSELIIMSSKYFYSIINVKSKVSE